MLVKQFLQDTSIFKPNRLIQNPKVSVVLPTYCRGSNGLLKKSIESVLSQSYQSFELIVIDDGSVDGTKDIISDFIKNEDRIIHIRHEKNCGLPALRVNEGLLLSRGEYCTYQFDDDEWNNIMLSSLVGILETHKNFNVAYGKSEYITSEGVQILGGRRWSFKKLQKCNYIGNNAVVHRKCMFEQYGGYDMHIVMRCFSDWELWLRYGRITPFFWLDEFVSKVNRGLKHSLFEDIMPNGRAVEAQIAYNSKNKVLTPDEIEDYSVDKLEHLIERLGNDRTKKIQNEQINPFLERFTK